MENSLHGKKLLKSWESASQRWMLPRNNGRISFVQYVQNGAKSQGMKQLMAN